MRTSLPLQGLLLSLALGFTPGASRAEEATLADPERYSVDFENEDLRAVRIRYGPREKSVMHDHPRAGLLVYLTDQRVRFTLPDGSTREVTGRAGETAWVEASSHRPENLEDRALELIYIEVKD